MCGVVNRRGDRIEETLIRIGREIDGDLRCRSDRAGDLDIQHHLAIRAARIAGRLVLPVVDRDRGNLGQRHVRARQNRSCRSAGR